MDVGVTPVHSHPDAMRLAVNSQPILARAKIL